VADLVVAFLSGVGAVLSAIISLNLARRRYEKECEERIAEVREAIHEGFEMGEHE
jgi:hypothetical protein